MARPKLAVAWFAVLVAVVGCNLDLRITGAATIEDLQAENRYKATYAEHIASIHADSEVFRPTASNPGVCNVGGNRQGCYEADAVLIQDLQVMLSALAATPLPPRYAEGDQLLKDAIATNIQALELRNKAIAEDDDVAWDQHQIVLQGALALYEQAYAAFPDDNRPEPPP